MYKILCVCVCVCIYKIYICWLTAQGFGEFLGGFASPWGCYLDEQRGVSQDQLLWLFEVIVFPGCCLR